MCDSVIIAIWFNLFVNQLLSLAKIRHHVNELETAMSGNESENNENHEKNLNIKKRVMAFLDNG